MIFDDNLISLDNVELSSGSPTAVAIPLTSLKIPGREEPIACVVKCTETAAGGTSVTLKLQESATQSGVYADVAGSTVTVLTSSMKKGENIYLRWLPKGVTKPWLKFSATVSGSYTAGKIIAAVVREDDLPYIAGQYIDKGRVVG